MTGVYDQGLKWGCLVGPSPQLVAGAWGVSDRQHPSGTELRASSGVGGEEGPGGATCPVPVGACRRTPGHLLDHPKPGTASSATAFTLSRGCFSVLFKCPFECQHQLLKVVIREMRHVL